MKRILLDTNGYADFKKKDPMAIGVIRSVEFMDSPRVHLLEIDEETAEF